MNKEMINFQVQADRVLALLSNEIYDSSQALLRENVQNAYDAILMRQVIDNTFSPQINVTLSGHELRIRDNGIGMTRAVVENNFWKAGASGKNTEEARKAGVVGTFGIGAMANFGVCRHLKVITRHISSADTIISEVDKDKLSLTEKCVELYTIQDQFLFGTEIIATLDDDIIITQESAQNYLMQFVKYVPIPILFNGRCISQKTYVIDDKSGNTVTSKRHYSNNTLEFDIDVTIQNFNNGNASAYVFNIQKSGAPIHGDIFLKQDGVSLFGLRNGFGLANIPVASSFSLGGVANLSCLVPTAGRDALSKDSISFVSTIVRIVDSIIAEELSKNDIADKNRHFLAYILQRNLSIPMGGKIQIRCHPDTYMKLEDVQCKILDKEVRYYIGSDESLLNMYSHENSLLLLPSNDITRQQIQLKVLNERKIPQVSNNPTILKKYARLDCNYAETAMCMRVASILEKDYFLSNVDVCFADISHQTPYLVKKTSEQICVYLSRNSSNVKEVLRIYDTEIGLFDSFVKDFVRCRLYPQFAQHVPSSTKEGTDALFRSLMQKKELYTIKREERGEVEAVVQDYIEGKKTLKQAMKELSIIQNLQTQVVHSNQVGSVETELKNVLIRHDESIKMDYQRMVNEYVPQPPIRIPHNETQMKILKTNQDYDQLNGFNLFLALSDDVFAYHMDVFQIPHTTKVIWGMHKIVYIFTDPTGRISTYYEIELQKQLPQHITGGRAISTTTIISKNRVFVPVVKELMPYFDIQSLDTLSFYVRFDTIFESIQKTKDDKI